MFTTQPLQTPPGPPDPPEAPDFLPYTWQPGTTIVRCSPEPHDPVLPYVSPQLSRFSPFRHDDGDDADLVATLYGASTALGALSETIFHDVPVEDEAKSIYYGRLIGRFLVDLVCSRGLVLADLTMPAGLRRIGVSRAKMIESGPDRYSQTVKWAEAAYRDPRRFDGMTWISRQDDSARALVLFAGRGWEGELGRAPGAEKLPLTGPETLDWVLSEADLAGVTVRGAPFMPG